MPKTNSRSRSLCKGTRVKSRKCIRLRGCKVASGTKRRSYCRKTRNSTYKKRK